VQLIPQVLRLNIKSLYPVINIAKKISFLGDIGVGKTTLMNKMLQNSSHPVAKDSKLQICSKNIPIEDNMLMLSFWDLGTQISKQQIPASYYISSDMVLYVFDVSDPESYLQLEQDIRIISEVNPNCIIKIIGNKVDKIDDFNEETWVNMTGISPNYFISTNDEEDIANVEREITFEFLSHHPELLADSTIYA